MRFSTDHFATLFHSKSKTKGKKSQLFVYFYKNAFLTFQEYFSNQEYIMPGRQITIFLFLFNLAQWIVFTFEIQKVRASQVEEDFYGFMPWVLIQRVTLPLAVFFRFHSAVVSIELWKEVYHENTQPENYELNTLPAGDSTKI